MNHDSTDSIGMILLLKGRVRIYTLSNEGKELTLYRLTSKDICLLTPSGLFPDMQSEIFAETETEAEILHIPADFYQRLMKDSIAVTTYTNLLLQKYFANIVWLIDQLLNKKLYKRLAAFLLEESELEASKELCLTHEQIANHLGSVREVVTRMLKHFQNEKMVRLARGTIFLLDTDRLNLLAADSMR